MDGPQNRWTQLLFEQLAREMSQVIRQDQFVHLFSKPKIGGRTSKVDGRRKISQSLSRIITRDTHTITRVVPQSSIAVGIEGKPLLTPRSQDFSTVHSQIDGRHGRWMQIDGRNTNISLYPKHRPV